MTKFCYTWLTILIDGLIVVTTWGILFFSAVILLMIASKLIKSIGTGSAPLINLSWISMLATPYVLTAVGVWKLGFLFSLLYAAFSVFILAVTGSIVFGTLGAIFGLVLDKLKKS